MSNELRTEGRLKHKGGKQRIAETFRLDGDDLLVEVEGGSYRLPMKHRYLFCPPAVVIVSGIEASDLERLFNRLTGCECVDKREEIDILGGMIESRE